METGDQPWNRRTVVLRNRQDCKIAAAPIAGTQPRTRPAAVARVTIPARKAGRSHPSHSGSAVPARSRTALPHRKKRPPAAPAGRGAQPAGILTDAG